MRAITHTFLQARWSAAQLHNSDDSYFLPPLNLIQTYSLHFTDFLGFNCYTLFNSPLITDISAKIWLWLVFLPLPFVSSGCERLLENLSIPGAGHVTALTECLCPPKTPSTVQLPEAWHLPQCAPSSLSWKVFKKDTAFIISQTSNLSKFSRFFDTEDKTVWRVLPVFWGVSDHTFTFH